MIKVLIALTFLAGCSLDKSSNNIEDKFKKVQEHSRFSLLISDVSCDGKKQSAKLKNFQTRVQKKVKNGHSRKIVTEYIRIHLDSATKRLTAYISSGGGYKYIDTTEYELAFGALRVKELGEIYVGNNGLDMYLKISGAENDGLLRGASGPVVVTKSSDRHYFNYLCN